MKKNTIYAMLLWVSALMVSCSSTPDIQSTMLDSGTISYQISDSLQKHLVSRRFSHLSEAQKNIPVIIAAHGYTATTFEWDELRHYADSAKTFYVSQVLLGGHGRSYTDFKKATWEDWQSSIKEEYKFMFRMLGNYSF